MRLNQLAFSGLGQVTRSYQAVNGAVDTSTTPFVQYDYSDPSIGSRLIDMVYPNGRTIDYNYGDTNFGAGAVLMSNHNAMLDNAIGRVDAIVDGPNSGDPGTVLEQYSYLGLSTIVQAAHPQTGINLTYIQQPGQTNILSDGGDIYTGLDRFGRVIDQNWWVVATGASTDRFQYGYDANSNVLYKNNLLSASNSDLYHANSTAPGDNNTAYDPLNRMTYYQRGYLTASGNDGSSIDTAPRAYTQYAWQLDALGSWTSYNTYEVPQTRACNSQNEITGASGPGITTTPQYDANGNMTTDQNGNTLTYDAWNRLVAVKNAGGQVIAAYTYNALGYRISESYAQGGNGVAAGTVKYLYYSNNWQVLETRWNGTAVADVAHQYVWSQMYIDAMVLRDTYSSGTVQPAQRIYYQHDANFNTTAIVGLVGGTWQVTQRYIYDPYGNVTVLNADWTNASSQIPLTQYMHQGGRQDPITGLYDFRHRDYSPTLGNWIEQDPAGYINGASRYQAEIGSPVGTTDPVGEFGWTHFWVGAGQLAGGIGIIVGGAGMVVTGIFTADPLLGLAGADVIMVGAVTSSAGLINGTEAFSHKRPPIVGIPNAWRVVATVCRELWPPKPKKHHRPIIFARPWGPYYLNPDGTVTPVPRGVLRKLLNRR